MKHLMSLLRFIDAVNDWTGKVVSFLLLPIVFVTLCEATARYVFNSPTSWAFDISLLFFGIYVLLTGGYAFRHRSHVNVDLIYEHLPIRVQAIFDLTTFFVFAAFIGGLFWKAIPNAIESCAKQEFFYTSVWHCPLYPVKVSIVIGAFLILIQGLAKFIRDIMKLIWNKETS